MKPLTARQERFCRRYVETANATAAARWAGYALRSVRSTAYRLLQEPHIAARIAALQAETGRLRCGAVETLLGKLEAVFVQAAEDGQFSVATRIVEAQGRLAGFSSTRGGAGRSGTAASPGPDSAAPPAKPINQGDLT